MHGWSGVYVELPGYRDKMPEGLSTYIAVYMCVSWQADDRDDDSLQPGPHAGPTWSPRCATVHTVHTVHAGRRQAVGRTGEKHICRHRYAGSYVMPTQVAVLYVMLTQVRWLICDADTGTLVHM